MLEFNPQRTDDEEEPLDITPDLADKLDETGEQVRQEFKGLTPDQIEDINSGHPRKVVDRLRRDFKERKTRQ